MAENGDLVMMSQAERDRYRMLTFLNAEETCRCPLGTGPKSIRKISAEQEEEADKILLHDMH